MFVRERERAQAFRGWLVHRNGAAAAAAPSSFGGVTAQDNRLTTRTHAL